MLWRLIAYELLTGKRLFEERDTNKLLEMHRAVEPTWIDEELADVPVSIRRALARALVKDPNERFATCGDLAVALGCQLLNAPVLPANVLLEADVPSMGVGLLDRRISFFWLKNSVHLVLTRDAIWSAYQTEIRRWPLDAVECVEPKVVPIDEEKADDRRRSRGDPTVSPAD